MVQPYEITRMTSDEVGLVLDWAGREGWNPGLEDAPCFYKTDPQGFFAGKLQGKIIAVGSAVVYDADFAFCGFYIVDKVYRGQGYGLELTKARLDYVGQRNVGIDGVVDMLDKYERLGYRFAHNNARYCLEDSNLSIQGNAAILPLNQIPFKQLCEYDRRHFPAARPQFLSCWIQQKNSLALGYMHEGQLQGYGHIRAGQTGFKIGPLFADSPTIATDLFRHLLVHAKGQAVFLDIPETNPHAIALAKDHSMHKVFATARMYLRGEPMLPIEEIYGITTFVLG